MPANFTSATLTINNMAFTPEELAKLNSAGLGAAPVKASAPSLLERLNLSGVPSITDRAKEAVSGKSKENSSTVQPAGGDFLKLKSNQDASTLKEAAIDAVATPVKSATNLITAPIRVAKAVVHDIPKETINLMKEQGPKEAFNNFSEGLARTEGAIAKPVLKGLSFAGNALLGTIQSAVKAVTGYDLGDKEAEKALTVLGEHLIQNKLADATTVVGGIKKFVTEDPEQVVALLSGANKTLSDIKGKPVDIVSDAANATKIPEVLPKVISAAGEKIKQSGVKSADVAREKFINDLVSPRDTVKVKEKELPRTKTEGKGPFKKDITVPSPDEAASAKAVSEIPEVKASNTQRENYRAIDEANTKEAEKLKADLKANDFVYDKPELVGRLDALEKELKKSPTLVGDIQTSAERLLNHVKDLIEKSDNMGSSILDIRKNFDAWVKSQKPTIFDSKVEGGMQIATRGIRDVLNKYLSEKGKYMNTGVGVDESLARQSALYDALDNLGPKAAREAETAVGRLVDKAKNITSVKTLLGADLFSRLPATIQAALTGVSATGYLLYKGGQIVMNPKLRIALGDLLKTSGQILSGEQKIAIEEAVIGKPERLLLMAPENSVIEVPPYNGGKQGSILPQSAFDKKGRVKQKYGSLYEYNKSVEASQKAAGIKK